MPLEMGGFGISRYVYDEFLYHKAKSLGVDFKLDTEVTNVEFMGQSFCVHLTNEKVHADVVVGAYGKRSKLDIQLSRGFVSKRSPFVGVKYHVRADHPKDVIALHNFPGGYCGICSVENDLVNVCYLSHRDNLKKYKSVEEMEKYVLWQNPVLKDFLLKSERLWIRPETINEISFSPKTAVQDHMLMIGDAAGMIAPLCGNGMAMAIHSAKIASENIFEFASGKLSRQEMEETYARSWSAQFSRRLWSGRQIQKLFGSAAMSRFTIGLILFSKPLARFIIRNTHGKTF
jgi:flavin-dependent dehydrogenase